MNHEKPSHEKDNEADPLSEYPSQFSEQELIEMARSAMRAEQLAMLHQRMKRRTGAHIAPSDSYYREREEEIRKDLDDAQWTKMQRDYESFINEGGDINNNDVSCQVYDFLRINGFDRENAPALFQKQLFNKREYYGGNGEIKDICVRDISAIFVGEDTNGSVSLIGALSYIYADGQHCLPKDYVDHASDLLTYMRINSERDEINMPNLCKREDGYGVVRDFRHRLIFLMAALEMELAKNPENEEDILKKYTIKCKVYQKID